MPSQLKIRTWDSQELPRDWFRRAQSIDESVVKDVKAIIAEVRKNGDAALMKFTEKFDKANVKPERLRIAQKEIKAAYSKATEEQVAAIKLIKKKVSSFEKATLNDLEASKLKAGVDAQTILVPIQSVGCYVPGGQAAYPSTVVMTVAPAKTARVPRIVVCSPPDCEGNVNPLVLVACDVCGVDEIYRVGGVQAIAALAYGTDTIEPVCKIVGPGNKYVTTAKILVSKDVAIDMPAGPSEVLVLADETAQAKFVAADMISQAEHSADSVVGLMTTSKKLARDVLKTLRTLAASGERCEIVRKALQSNGFIITCGTVDEMIGLANVFAPEHLEIMTQSPMEIANGINSAGLILIGPYSPVALSDYGSGTNHVLPTGGFAASYSGLSKMDFMRRMSVVNYPREGLQVLRSHVKVLTEAESLPNHSRAVEVRFED